MVWGKLPHPSVEIAGDADLVQATIANQINRFSTPHNQVCDSFKCLGVGCDPTSPIRGVYGISLLSIRWRMDMQHSHLLQSRLPFPASDTCTMPRPKKTELSKAVNPLAKRGNPDFVSSSFYVPKKVNLQFDRAILTLKANGFEVDRSDILSVLMDRFNREVDAAEQQDDGEGLNLQEILDGLETTVPATAALTYLKNQMQAQRDKEKELVAKLEQTSAEKDQWTDRMNSLTLKLVERMIHYVPEDERAPYEEAIQLMRDGSSAQAE